MQKVRYPSVAGSFYPADKADLQQTLDLFFRNTQPAEKLNIGCIISPHAGYIYSGAIAAEGFAQLSGQNYNTVVVISPSHFEYFKGCSIYPGNYKTPLGEIETDMEFCQKLTENSHSVLISGIGHGREHALEVQLPFLQFVLGSFKLVPIVMGEQNYKTAADLAELITSLNYEKPYSDKRVLIVSSTDLSHFYNAEQAKKLDEVIVSDIQSLDEIKLDQDILRRKGEACGYGPVISGIKSAKINNFNHCRITAYGHSGQVSNDFDRVVGYVSAIIFKN
ncbi:MAG: AmmeMemoRadiSam system protein B [Calditrichae bacterium]|nr:AmmeMemoRadiSam system protein B [Calditrichota bacterium]MCB9058936.1 AmmeMemoRadiSam system protein B [Calditrichia bacterium]